MQSQGLQNCGPSKFVATGNLLYALSKLTYRIGLNATPVLNTTPPLKNTNTTPVKTLS